MTSFYFFSVFLTNCLLLVSFLFGISYKQIWNNKKAKWYLYFLGFILCIEVTVKILIYGFDSRNTSFTYPIYIAGEFYFLSQMLVFCLGFSKKWMFISILISLAIFIEASYLWYNSPTFTTGYGKIFSHLVLVCMLAYFLIKSIKELKSSDPFLIIYSSLFFYYSVSVFLFLLIDQLTRNNIIVWTMNNLLSAFLYGTSIYTFYRLKKSY